MSENRKERPLEAERLITKGRLGGGTFRWIPASEGEALCSPASTPNSSCSAGTRSSLTGTVNHMPLTREPSTSIFDFGSIQKTIKTGCNRRVPMAQANYQQETTCTECLVWLQRQREETQRLYDALKDAGL